MSADLGKPVESPAMPFTTPWEREETSMSSEDETAETFRPRTLYTLELKPGVFQSGEKRPGVFW